MNQYIGTHCFAIFNEKRCIRHFSLKTIPLSQNYPLKMHNIYETILLTIFHVENYAVLCPEHILPPAKRKANPC